MLKRRIKRVFARLNALPLFDRMHFLAERIRYARQNKYFRVNTPGFAIPPDEFLHETYRLNYRDYALDGAATARELVDRIRPWLPTKHAELLEWGCGVARITRHLPYQPDIGQVTGADIHAGMIDWNKSHIPEVTFIMISEALPTDLPAAGYDAVIGISVLTHIPADRQQEWLMEIHRWLKPGGVCLLTTHGTKYHRLLSTTERQHLQTLGCITQTYPKAGHRMMTTLHDAHFMNRWLSAHFEVLQLIEGKSDPDAAGGQDLWIVRKPGSKD
jgi:ubiquinone/menaquinone biosynthesis C-methylase UbiE